MSDDRFVEAVSLIAVMRDEDELAEVRLRACTRYLDVLQEVASDPMATPDARTLAQVKLDAERVAARMETAAALSCLAEIAAGGGPSSEAARNALREASEHMGAAGADISRWPAVPPTKQ